MQLGFLYVATGEWYINESIESAKSVKKFHPDIKTCIFTDTAGDLAKHFDIVNVIPNPQFNFHDKVYGIKRSPFKKTVFLDTDTRVVKPINELFDTLEYFDMGFALDASVCSGNLHGVPKTFVEPNNGVLVYKESANNAEMFDEWEKLHYEESLAFGRLGACQPSFRAVLYRSKVRFFVLPYGYNFITNRAIPIESFTDVKIVHGREPWAYTIGDNKLLNDLTLIKRLYLPASHFKSSNVVLGGYENVPEYCFRAFRGMLKYLAKIKIVDKVG